MTQYPDEKGHPDWVLPSQQEYPPQYGAPQGPPPDYGYALSHPAGDDKKGAAREAVLAPPASYVDAGPSTSTQEGLSLGSFFGTSGPPTMWHRQPPPHFSYDAFPPMCLISNGWDLGKGFPELPPPCQLNPHPFATHDVTEEDWKRFLTDLKRAGSLSPVQRIKSNVIPMVTGVGLISSIFMTSGIERRMKSKNRGAAGDLVDHWNHYFFGPRRMEAVLCQASERLSGRLGAAPLGDPDQQRMARKLRKRADSSSSDSSSSEDRPHDRHARRAARRERREARRERRAERRARKARGDYKEPYLLYITAM